MQFRSIAPDAKMAPHYTNRQEDEGMRMSLSKAYAALLLGAVTLATIACGIGGDADEVERTPDMEHMESSGATVDTATTEPQLVQSAPPSAATPAALTIVTTTTEPTYFTTDDLDDAPDGSSDGRSKIVAHSTLILIGTAPEADPRVERIPGRLTGDPSRPDPNWTTIAYVHDVQVERYLKGRGPATIPVMQPTGHENISPGSGATPGLLNHVRYSAHNFYFERGGRYLLFLRESEHAPGLWMGTAEPYKYQLFEGRARARTPARDPGRAFYTRRGEEELLERVQDVVDYQSAFASSGIPNRVRWNLEFLDGRPRLEGTLPTLTVDGNAYGGSDGCNSFGGQPEGPLPVAAQNGTFSRPAEGIAATLALCVKPDGIMEQAEAYELALRNGRTFEIDGYRLKILDGSGKVRLVFVRRATLPGQPVELAGTRWRMVDETGDYAGVPTPTLVFLDEHLAGGTTTCRDFILDYRVREDGSLSFSGKGRYGPADSCSEETIELERSFRRGLSSDDYAVDDRSGESVLRIRTYRDEILSFEPLPQAAEDRIYRGEWSLVAFTKPDRVNSWHTDYAKTIELVPETELTISFEEGALQGSGECHSYEASLNIEGSEIEVDHVRVTEKPCDDSEGVVEQETRFAEALERATFFRIYGERLFVQTDNDEALLFRAE